MAKQTRKTTRPVARVQQRSATPTKTTALARRAPAATTVRIIDPTHQLPAPAAIDINYQLTEQASVGELGLVEVKLTPEEERILNEPVNEADVLIKPTGAIYLSHPSYTKWFNRAFGRLGWAIVPRSTPMKSGRSVVCPYLLYIHGHAAAFAMGEQEYHDNNADQSYGDALEATVASALRRCAKRLGVGLELWEPAWTQRFVDEHCVKVLLKPRKDGDDPKTAWRLKRARPFWNEVKILEDRTPPSPSSKVPDERDFVTAPREPVKRAAPTSSHAAADDVITEAQAKRLWAIATKAGRTHEAVKAWLIVGYNVESSKAIKRRDYDAIISAIEKPGPLGVTTPASREPGEEG